ncbi:MAG: lactate racemase domain-containing protein [Candidatus Geothermincolales bacterium]
MSRREVSNVKILAFYGDDLVQVDLPENTRILKAPPPLPALEDYREAVRRALRDPIGCPPLASMVKPGFRVTVAFDDPCLPLPPPIRDPRTTAVEVVLEELFTHGVERERVTLVCANGLHRKWTPRELRRVLGKRVWSAMGPHRVTNHDAEDPHGVVDLGRTENGYPVAVNRLLTESDLAIYVNVNWTSMNGGWKSYMVGLGTYRSIRAHHDPGVLVEGGTVMDPTSRFHRIMSEQGKHLARHANLFSVETVLDNRVWPFPLDRLLSLSRTRVPLPFRVSRRLPDALKSVAASMLRSAYRPVAVFAGHPGEVHPRTLEVLLRQQNVRVERQFDALFLSLPNISPYAAYSRMNPLLVANSALGYVFNMHIRRPLVRPGGVLVLMQPFRPGFHPRHHLPYIEFYERVLAETLDPREMERSFEEDFARRDEYLRAYRFGYSYHGVHPFYVWYWCGIGLRQLGRVIVVGARDVSVVRRLGFDSAPSLETAWKMAEELLGRGFSLAHMSLPPIFAAELA